MAFAAKYPSSKLNEKKLKEALVAMKMRTQSAITCSKLTIETLEHSVKYVQS